jgi:hypothetical protein
MGGWMTYQRVRDRNGLREDSVLVNVRLVADLDRMERDYLAPVYPRPPFARREDGSDPVTEVSDATGVDTLTVRKVLRYIFKEQR